jgi:hypothetical protein
VRLAAITAILASAALIAAPAALADGDPASDVLVESVLFNPIDGVSLASQARLEAVLNASARAGFPIRVALIASAKDLGTVTPLWNRSPKYYAQYLDTELSLSYGGQVLVVMPSGFGLHGPAHGPHAVTPAEAAVRAPAPGPGKQLGTSALAAVPLLAAADGHPIPAPALAAATRAATLGEKAVPGTDFSPSVVIALLLGALLIALAWWASLRARPLQLRRSVEP